MDFKDLAITNARDEFGTYRVNVIDGLAVSITPIVLPLRVVCSWCQKVLQEGAPEAKTSHTCCPECYAEHFPEDLPCER